jgi:hypothetical protein
MAEQAAVVAERRAEVQRLTNRVSLRTDTAVEDA